MKFVLINIVLLSLAYKLTFAQINGEFWWLNSKLAAITGSAPSAKFEDLGEFDNDENDKIVFWNVDMNFNKDIELDIPYYSDKNKSAETEELNLQFDLPIIEKNTSTTKKYSSNNIYVISSQNNTINKNTTYPSIKNDTRSEDNISFSFPKVKPENKHQEVNYNQIVFPSEENIIDINNFVSKYRNRNNKTSSLNHKYYQNLPDLTDVEFICNFISYDSCQLRKGFVYESPNKRVTLNRFMKKETVCCIFTNNERSKPSDHKIRFPRSVYIAEDTGNRGQKQRESLLKKIFNVRPLTTSQTKTKKIVNDYDYVDPYWNIKNTNLKSPVKVAKPTSDAYDVIYDSVESEEDYASEVPKPGLLGSYSAQATRRPLEFNWAENNNNKRPSQTFDSYSGSGNSGYYNGYSTLDPRIDDRTLFKRPKPIKPIESSSEEIYDAESHIVTYQANPDFQVLRDFKLLNLIRNKSPIYDRNSKKSTTEKVTDYDSLESTRPSFGSSSSEVIYDDVDDDDRQLYEDCGRRTVDYDTTDDDSNSSFGTHPWILLVVRTRKQHRTLCSATLIHSRAALTAATCVNGAAAGEVVVRAGEWDLREVGHSQQRLASIYVHQLYQEDTLNHNLAVLHWARPLRMTAAVQPACLGDPEVGSACNFVGWGGIDQKIRSRPQVQRAAISKRRPCASHLNNADLFRNMPLSAFCATTDDNKCVSGIGASLLCLQKGRVAAVGVTAWRSECDRTPQILIQSRDWAMRTLRRLGIS